MNYIGIDLHKHIIIMYVMNSEREILVRRKYSNDHTKEMSHFFES